jgi:hypothetical protein
MKTPIRFAVPLVLAMSACAFEEAEPDLDELAISETSAAMCGATDASWPVWRIQLFVQVDTSANSDSAGDNTFVQLRTSGASFRLNKGGQDFTLGAQRVYDLDPRELGIYNTDTKRTDLSFIQQLKLWKEGADGIRIKKVELRINGDGTTTGGVPIFSMTASTYWVLDAPSAPALTWSTSVLRNNSAWTGCNSALFAVPTRVSEGSMENMVESFIGEVTYEIDSDYILSWDSEFLNGTEWVSGWRETSTRMHFDADLGASVGLWPDAAVDVDFDITVACVAGRLTFTPSAIDVNVDSIFVDALRWTALPAMGFTGCPSSFYFDSGYDLILDW